MTVWSFMGMVKHSHSSQNSKFAMSLRYLKKEVRYEVDFLFADKHQSCCTIWFPASWFQHFRRQSFLQGDTMIMILIFSFAGELLMDLR